MYPFKEVTYRNLGPMPAMVDISTGQLMVNPAVMGPLPSHWQRYIILHEMGHLVNKTTDEKSAAEFANDNFIRPEHAEKDLNDLVEILNCQPATAEQHEKINAERSLWQSKNENLAGFFNFLLTAFSWGANKVTSDQKKKDQKTDQSKAEDAAWLDFSNLSIEQERVLRAFRTYLPWLTLAIIAIVLIIIVKK